MSVKDHLWSPAAETWNPKICRPRCAALFGNTLVGTIAKRGNGRASITRGLGSSNCPILKGDKSFIDLSQKHSPYVTYACLHNH